MPEPQGNGQSGTWALIAAGLVCGSGAFVQAQSPAEFSTQVTLAVPAGTAIARVALPAATLASLRGVGGGDLRVFNGNGQALPHALIDAAAAPLQRQEAEVIRTPAWPIYDETLPDAPGAPTLRIVDGGPTRRVIEYSSPASPASAAERTKHAAIRGWLFDLHASRQDIKTGADRELRGVALEGALPPSTLIRMTVAASTDLKHWRTLAADFPVFDFTAPGSAVGGAPRNRRIDFAPGTRVAERYLRLTVSGAPATALSISALRSIGVEQGPRAAPVNMELGGPDHESDGGVQWRLPVTLHAQALRLATRTENALLPVRVSTRARAGEPWRLVAQTVVYRLRGADGSISVNPAQALAMPLDREVRVAPEPGYRFDGVPITLTLDFAPLHVLFIATAPGPFVIASGNAGLASTALPVATLLPGYKAGDEFAISELPQPDATSDGRADATSRALRAPAGDVAATGWRNRTTALWAVLIAAVAVLGGIAVALLRAPGKRAGENQELVRDY